MEKDEIERMKLDLRAQVEMMARPIDFMALEKAGVITKEGAWYRVHSISMLPDYARIKINDIAEDNNGLKVRFSKVPIAVERLAASFVRLDTRK